MAGKIRASLPFAVAGILLAAAVFLLAGYAVQRTAAEFPEAPSYTEYDGQLCPDIDWDYWKDVNPDVIGWVTVPGTDIDQPIVQASSSDPDYYLTHDVYGRWNVYGCPYLDADCGSSGFASPNAIVYGHHMDDGTVFAAFSDYADASFASEHRCIILQTPSSRMVLSVRFADVVDADAALKFTSFPSEKDYKAWYSEQLAGADMVLDSSPAPHNVITFCTCSYYFNPSNERTLVYTSL